MGELQQSTLLRYPVAGTPWLRCVGNGSFQIDDDAAVTSFVNELKAYSALSELKGQIR